VRKHGAERQCATLLQLALSATEATGPGRSDENQWRVGDRQRILLVDLLPGHAAPAVCAAVLRALLRKTAVVLGYGLRNDLQRILPPLLSALGAGGPSVNAQDNNHCSRQRRRRRRVRPRLRRFLVPRRELPLPPPPPPCELRPTWLVLRRMAMVRKLRRQ
jgi:hypothetical protein